LSTIAAEVAAGERVLCFFNSVKAMHYLEERLQERGLDVASLDGNSKNPAALASAFRDEKLKILLVGPSSQRGLNLQGASVVLHGDLPLDLNQYQQRNARAARIGGKDQIRALVPVLVPSLEVALVKQIGIPGSDKLNQVGSSE
jgi:superfamily II DNA/RNA helicase